jgi:hypothetical protein
MGTAYGPTREAISISPTFPAMPFTSIADALRRMSTWIWYSQGYDTSREMTPSVFGVRILRGVPPRFPEPKHERSLGFKVFTPFETFFGPFLRHTDSTTSIANTEDRLAVRDEFDPRTS